MATLDTIQTFMAYAADFEKTYADDDWERIKRHFADDAVYQVKAKSFGCELIGPDAIAAGLKKSLDGFDRKFDSREIEIVTPPTVNEAGDELSSAWLVHYKKAGYEPFTLRGRSVARCADGKITRLTDIYEPSVEQEFVIWHQSNPLDVNPAYT